MTQGLVDSDSSQIFILDDDEENLKLISSILGRVGYDVYSASSSKQLLSKASESVPDIFLLDINVPDIDGFEVCRRLKESDNLKDIPVIFISAEVDIANKEKGFSVGAIDYIVKPYNIDEVKFRVAIHLKLYHKMKEIEFFNRAMANREMRVVELKEEVNALARELDREIPYPQIWDK